jgi:XRE family transcriptional regulator, fatty acid utilization regulator
VSYLSEIEKGKKYPKPGKLIDLARALEVPFDSLVTLQVEEKLDPVKAVFSSSLLREFPFDLFGVEPQDLFDLVTQDPTKAGALLRTFLEVGRLYDVHAEHFLLAALRSYQPPPPSDAPAAGPGGPLPLSRACARSSSGTTVTS